MSERKLVPLCLWHMDLKVRMLPDEAKFVRVSGSLMDNLRLLVSLSLHKSDADAENFRPSPGSFAAHQG